MLMNSVFPDEMPPEMTAENGRGQDTGTLVSARFLFCQSEKQVSIFSSGIFPHSIYSGKSGVLHL